MEEKLLEIKNQLLNNQIQLNNIRSFSHKHSQYQNILKQTWYENLRNFLKCILNNINIEDCKCKQCHKQLTVTQALHHNKFCSAKCNNNCKETKDKFKQTMVQKYGVQNASFSQKLRDKANQTNLTLYGTKNVRKSPIIKQKIKNINLQRYGVTSILKLKQTHDKAKEKMKELYGVEYGLQSKEILDKAVTNMLSEQSNKKRKETCLEKYGTEYVTQSPQFVNQVILTKRTNYFNNRILKFTHVKPNFDLNYWLEHKCDDTFQWTCTKCNNTFSAHLGDGIIPICRHCNPIILKRSGQQNDVYQFIKTIYNKEILLNKKSIIPPKELDIYLPDIKVAVEYNGLYWHSDANERITPTYHLEKTLACEEKGIKLIHIFEHEWITKQQIIKAKLRSIICNDIESVYARKCQIKQVKAKESNQFLNNYHLQGEDRSSIRLGLYYQNELVALMTFCKPRFNKKYDWQLSRYTTSKRVIGGASKLLKYFRDHYTGSIITYCDRRFSIGNMYQKIGFKLDHVSEPNYWWTKNETILSRYQTQKHKLKKLLGEENFNKDLSENQNMMINNYNKLYDCGNLVYVI